MRPPFTHPLAQLLTHAITRSLTHSLTDSSAIARFLVERRVVEELFGPRMHAELAKRSIDLLRFLAQRDLLTDAHVQLLWEASVGKQESISLSVYGGDDADDDRSVE